MKVLLLIALNILFFSYRIYFWDSSMAELINMSSNALLDTFISFGCGFAIYTVSNLKRKAIDMLYQGIGIIGFFILSSFLLWCSHFLVYTLTGSMDTSFKYTFYTTGFQIFDLFSVLVIGSVITFAVFKSKALNEREKKLTTLSEERKIAELKFLRSQMDPHFIFNTLNTIQYSINKEDKIARKLVNDFSDLFRFHLYEFNELLIPLEKEIVFIMNYIAILRVRKSDTEEIFIDIEGSVDNKFIPPLVMIPIVENSIKHSGNFFGKKSQIDINIKINDDSLIIVSRNTKGDDSNTIKERRGIGLDNIKKRLNLQYPEQYSLKIDENDHYFELILTIPVVDEMLYNR